MSPLGPTPSGFPITCLQFVDAPLLRKNAKSVISRVRTRVHLLPRRISDEERE
jgi:hypothetical protein